MQKEKIGFYMILLVVLALVGSGIAKFVGAAEMGEAFNNAKVPYILGVLEFVIAIGILLPKTRLLGIILAASYFGGAIAISWLFEGELPIAPAAINTILYVGTALYRPSVQAGAGAGFAKP